MHTQSHDAPKSYLGRFAIVYRYALHAKGYSRLEAVAWSLTDPIARLNPIYCKAGYAASMVRHTADAICDRMWRARMERRAAR